MRTPGSPAAATWGQPGRGGSYLALVNSDALVSVTALTRLLSVAAESNVGIATSSLRLAAAPDTINSAGIACASGAALVLRRSRWEELGGFFPGVFRLPRGHRTELALLATRIDGGLCPGLGGAAPLRVLPKPHEAVPGRAQSAGPHPQRLQRATTAPDPPGSHDVRACGGLCGHRGRVVGPEVGRMVLVGWKCRLDPTSATSASDRAHDQRSGSRRTVQFLVSTPRTSPFPGSCHC